MEFSGADFESAAGPWNSNSSSSSSSSSHRTMSHTDRYSQRVPGSQDVSVVDTAGLLMVAFVLFTLLVAVRVWLCCRDRRDKACPNADREERLVSSQILDLECLSAYGTPRHLGKPPASSYANMAGSVSALHLNMDSWASEDRDSVEAWYRQGECDRHSVSSNRTWLLDTVDLLDVIVEESETSSGHRSVSTTSSRCQDHTDLSQPHNHGGQYQHHDHNDQDSPSQFYDHTSQRDQSYHDHSDHNDHSGHSQYYGHSDQPEDDSGSSSSSLFLSCSQEMCNLTGCSNTDHTDMEYSDTGHISEEHSGLHLNPEVNSDTKSNNTGDSDSDHSDMTDSDEVHTSLATSDTSAGDYRTCSQRTQPSCRWAQATSDHSHSSATSSEVSSECLDLSPVSFHSLSAPTRQHGDTCQSLSPSANTTWDDLACQLLSPGAHAAVDNDTCQLLSPGLHASVGHDTC